jgi:adrenodoxin-NADP+ reductase
MGNVSLDVARILLTPVDHLRKTEMRDDVLDVLRSSTLKHVSVLGRRGPLEAKFGNKEVREMMAIDGAGFVPPSPGALDIPADVKLTRQQTRFLSLLKAGSSSTVETASRSWDLQFYRSPTEMTPASRSVSNPRGHDYLYDLQVSRTTLSAAAPSAPSTPKPDTVAVPTSTTSTIGTDLLVTSLGQLTAPISLSNPFTSSPPSSASSTPTLSPLETLITSSNRIYTSSNRLVKNVYTSGWAAIGARGVLNTTLMDAYSLSDMILTDNVNSNADLPPSLDTESPPSALGTPPPNPMEPPISLLPSYADLGEEIPPVIEEGVKDGKVVTYEDWKVVDEYELGKGKEQGKDRVKLVWSEALEKGLVRR